MKVGKPFFLATLLMGAVLAGPSSACGQVTDVSAPEDDPALEIAESWGKRCSSLGGLRTMSLDSGDVAFRFWGVNGDTRGVSLRRSKGHWTAKAIQVERRKVEVPDSIEGDSTAVRTFVKGMSAKDCTVVSLFGPRQNFMVDTIRVSPPPKESELSGLWEKLLSHGIMEVPPDKGGGGFAPDDGHLYVVEVRRGNRYRASVIPGNILTVEQSDNKKWQEAVQRVERVERMAGLIQKQFGVPVLQSE